MNPQEQLAEQISKGRDDFPISIKEMLAKRVGFLCSNPDCQKPTSGPQEDPSKAINIGVASHISAASVGGPRYNSDLTPAERASIANGIWLCQNCGKLIDNDSVRYSVNLLNSWKAIAEDRAARALEQQRDPSQNDERISKIERLMPELLVEMRNDLSANPLCREFIVLQKGMMFWYPSDRTMFTYYVEDHPDIGNKLRILQNSRLIRDIRNNNTPRYAIEEEFADYLLAQMSGY